MDIRVPAGRQVTKYSAFAAMHPWTNFIYITLVLVITMFTMNPVILAVSYAGSLALGIYMQGGSFIKKNIMRLNLSRGFSAKYNVFENRVQNIRRADSPQRLRIIGSKVFFYL